MITKAQKNQMRDYVVARLEGSSDKIVPVTPGKAAGIDCNYILVGDDGIVFLVDSEFPNKGLRKMYDAAVSSKKSRIAALPYKDGRTFFRDAANGEKSGLQGNSYKSALGLSLRNYTPEQVHRMITLRPEEKFLHGRNKESLGKFGWIQYYQPASAELQEGIESFRFQPVRLDTLYLPEGAIGRGVTDSKRIYIWDGDRRVHSTGPMDLSSRVLQERKAVA